MRCISACVFLVGEEEIWDTQYDQEGVVPFVVDAVYALAHALHSMIRENCNGKQFCEAVDPPDGPTLLAFIRNTTFIGSLIIPPSVRLSFSLSVSPFICLSVCPPLSPSLTAFRST